MTPSDRRLVMAVLVRAFDLVALRAHLHANVGVDLDLVAIGTEAADVAAKLVEAAEAAAWEGRLVRSLCLSPRVEVADKDLLLRICVPGDALQGLTCDTEPMVDPAVQAAGMRAAQGRVFLVEIDGRHRGSGFLVGADLALTSRHVLDGLLGRDGTPDSGSAARISIRFDYTSPTEQGVAFGVAEDWHLASSHSHPLDSVLGQHACEQFVDALDFVLFRLDRAIGLARSPHGPGNLRRGWYSLGPERGELRAARRLYVFGHPHGRHLMTGDGRVTEINENATRVRYDASTARGVSGAPCLDADMRLVAVHVSGDPRGELEGRLARYNQGVPVGRISEALHQRGLGALLVDPPPEPEVVLQLGAREPILDRLPLQRTLLAMGRDDRTRLLFIDGDAGAGRQFTRLLVHRLAERSGHPCASVEMEAYVGSTPDRIVESIALDLDLPLEGLPGPPEACQSTRWPNRLAAWLCGRMRSVQAGGGTTWLVFDCVSGFPPREGTSDLLVEIADRALLHAFLRVVVIGAGDALPSRLRDRAERQVVGAIASVDLSRYLQEMAALNSFNLDHAGADELSDDVFSELPAAGRDRWEKLISETNLLVEGMEGRDHG